MSYQYCNSLNSLRTNYPIYIPIRAVIFAQQVCGGLCLLIILHNNRFEADDNTEYHYISNKWFISRIQGIHFSNSHSECNIFNWTDRDCGSMSIQLCKLSRQSGLVQL